MQYEQLRWYLLFWVRKAINWKGLFYVLWFWYLGLLQRCRLAWVITDKTLPDENDSGLFVASAGFLVALPNRLLIFGF